MISAEKPLFSISLFFSGRDFLQSGSFDCSFSSGDFISASRESSKAAKQQQPTADCYQEAPGGGVLFSCPSEGCVKVYQRPSSLEKHLSFGKCKLVAEKESFMDMAKKKYHRLLEEGSSTQKTIGGTDSNNAARAALPEGWALKTAKKSVRFSEAQKAYLNEKFSIGQESGHKQDPETVAKDMRSAKKLDGSRMFPSDEFLTAQQIQSYFSRMASKLRNEVITDLDARAIQQEQHYREMRQTIVQEVQLRHPITYDNINLCEMTRRNTLSRFSLAMLQTLCDFFDLNTEDFDKRRKAEYISVLRDLAQSCDCFTSAT